MAREMSPIQLPRTVTAVASAALGVIVVAGMYWGQAVLIPVAAAMFLTFLLAPVVTTLQRWGLWRIPAVVVTVVLATLVLSSVGWIVTRQFTGLVKSLSQPGYTQNISDKVLTVMQWMQGGVLDDLKHLAQEVQQTVQEKAKASQTEPFIGPPPPPDIPPPQPTVPDGTETTAGLDFLPESLGQLVEPLGQAALAVVLVVFMLVKREDLRNRLIRLIGHGRITVTTRAIDDAGSRISRFLLAQLFVNGTYGLAFGIGLFLLDVPYAFLWGFLAAVLRYVPYLGAWIAALMPIALSLASTPSWVQPLWVLGLVLVLELISNNLMEPWLYGQSIGVSEVALLVAAAFWTWLWGPVGLVLSAPLTVCLVVLGKYVPQLEFFDILLGDAPALPPRLVFYQRLLARDRDEAANVVDQAMRVETRERVYNDFLIPALSAARRDHDRGDIVEQDQSFILDAVRELAEDIAEREPVPADSAADRPADGTSVRILGCPAQDESDAIALHLFRDLLDPAKWEVELLSTDALSSELLKAVEQLRPAVLCIAALPPGTLAHTRYLCKRLRQRYRDLKILVGLWGLTDDADAARQTLADAGADAVATTLAATRMQLAEWLPAFQAQAAAPVQTQEREPVSLLV